MRWRPWPRSRMSRFCVLIKNSSTGYARIVTGWWRTMLDWSPISWKRSTAPMQSAGKDMAMSDEGRSERVEQLIGALRDDNEALRDHAIASLSQVGEEAIGPLIGL